MNPKEGQGNIPQHLLMHEDKVLYTNGNWIITRGITHDGHEIPSYTPKIHVYYYNGPYRIITFTTEEFYNQKYRFWKIARRLIANRLVELRNEEN